MTCAVIANLAALRQRSMLHPAWAWLTRCVQPGGRLHWRRPRGGYALYRGLAAESIDLANPVGMAGPGGRIGEVLAARPITDGVIHYAVRAINGHGREDTADPPTQVALTLVAGVVQPPAPLPIEVWQVEPLAGGRYRVTAQVNNIGAAIPARTLRIYSDGGTGGGVDWETPVGDPVALGSAYGSYKADRDPGLPHGTVVEVGIRVASSWGVEELNVHPLTVTLDAQAPAPLAGTTVEAVCD